MQVPARLVPLVLTALLALSAASERDAIPVDNFEGAASEDGLPEGWSELTFDSIERHTRYQVAEETPEGEAGTANQYLHAVSRDAASALYRRVDIDLKEHPILKWRWRIRRTVPRGDARSKETDDYAARLYVNFQYDPDRVGALTRIQYALAKRKLGEYPPLCSLNYIWANKLAEGTFIENAYSERAMMVAVRTGNKQAGEWVEEQRNCYEDFRKAFEGEPPPVTAVAVMVDTDNTGGRAEADFDDIRFERGPSEGGRAAESARTD